MRYREFKNSGRRSVLDIAREIARIHDWPPFSAKDKRWLISMSRNNDLIGKLRRGFRGINYRSAMHIEDQLLTDASDCAKAFRILHEIQDRIRRNNK